MVNLGQMGWRIAFLREHCVLSVVVKLFSLNDHNDLWFLRLTDSNLIENHATCTESVPHKKAEVFR